MEGAGLKPPVVLGHENAGWVHAVGDDVTDGAVGDAVLVYPPYSCGLCVPCRRGLDMHCERHGSPGSRATAVSPSTCSSTSARWSSCRRGRAGRRRAARRRRHHRLPRGEEAPPAARPGTTSAVIGVGGVGHIALQLLSVLGGGGVVAIDTDERRRTLARELGADEVLGEQADMPRLCARRRTGPAQTSCWTSSRPTRPTPPASRCSRGAACTRPSATAARHGPSVDSSSARRDRREPRRQLDRPLGAAPAARARRRDAADRDALAGRRERRARQASRGRGHRARRARSVIECPPYAWTSEPPSTR